jgi:predicted small metal-binding protein
MQQIETRKVIDCRLIPSESKCSLAIAGTEAEVLKAAAEHAVSSHGHTAGPELLAALRGALQDAKQGT